MPVIELDMLLAFVNRADSLHEKASKLFTKIVKGEMLNVKVAASAYLEYNLILRSKGYADEDVYQDVMMFKTIPNLGEIPLTSNIILEASNLRRKYGLTFFDSLHAASATIHDKEIISLDTAYANIKELKLTDPRLL